MLYQQNGVFSKNSVFGNVSHNSWDKVKKASKYEKNPKSLISAST